MRRRISSILDLVNPIPGIDAQRALDRLGLEPKRSLGRRWAPPAGGFGVGFGVGLGVGLFIAPKAGKELRAELRDKVMSWLESSESVEASEGSTPASFENEAGARDPVATQGSRAEA